MFLSRYRLYTSFVFLESRPRLPLWQRRLRYRKRLSKWQACYRKRLSKWLRSKSIRQVQHCKSSKLHNLGVYKQYHWIQSRKFDIYWLDKYLLTLRVRLGIVYTPVLCSLKVGRGCHCDNADFATGSVCPSDRLATGSVCPSDCVPNPSPRCSTVIRRIIHNHGVYKQYRRIRSRKFDMCWSDKYL